MSTYVIVHSLISFTVIPDDTVASSLLPTEVNAHTWITYSVLGTSDVSLRRSVLASMVTSAVDGAVAASSVQRKG